jgi:hypothetical protein
VLALAVYTEGGAGQGFRGGGGVVLGGERLTVGGRAGRACGLAVQATTQRVDFSCVLLDLVGQVLDDDIPLQL